MSLYLFFICTQQIILYGCDTKSRMAGKWVDPCQYNFKGMEEYDLTMYQNYLEYSSPVNSVYTIHAVILTVTLYVFLYAHSRLFYMVVRYSNEVNPGLIICFMVIAHPNSRRSTTICKLLNSMTGQWSGSMSIQKD